MGWIILAVIVYLIIHGHHTHRNYHKWHMSFGWSLLGPLGFFFRISRRIF